MVYVGCLDTKERHSRNQSRSRGGPKDKLTISQSRIFSPWNANYFFIDCFHVQFVHVLGKEEMENNVVCFLLDKLIHTGVVVHKVRQAYPSLIYCLHTYHHFDSLIIDVL